MYAALSLVQWKKIRRSIKGSEQPILLKVEPGLLSCQVAIQLGRKDGGTTLAMENFVCVFYHSLNTGTFFQEWFCLSKSTLLPRFL